MSRNLNPYSRSVAADTRHKSTFVEYISFVVPRLYKWKFFFFSKKDDST